MNDRTDFPYKSCLLLTIEEISAHNEYMYHGDKAKLDVVVLIEDVLKSGTLYNDPKNDTGFRKGARVTFVIDKPETPCARRNPSTLSLLEYAPFGVSIGGASARACIT